MIALVSIGKEEISTRTVTNLRHDRCALNSMNFNWAMLDSITSSTKDAVFFSKEVFDSIKVIMIEEKLARERLL